MALWSDTPQLYQKVRWDQNQFPEHKEQQQIKGTEDTHGQRHEQQDVLPVEPALPGSARRREQQRKQNDKGRKRQEQHGNAVHPQMISGPDQRHPKPGFGKLDVRCSGNKAPSDQHGQRQFKATNRQRHRTLFAFAAHELHQNRGKDWKADQHTQNRKTDLVRGKDLVHGVVPS